MKKQSKHIKNTENGFRIIGGNSRVSLRFKMNDLELSHSWQNGIYNKANAWNSLSDGQRYRRVVAHWNESLDLKLSRDEAKQNFASYWQFIDNQLNALNVIVESYNSTEPAKPKRYFTRTESICKKLYPSFLLNEPVNIMQIVKEFETIEAE
jgi:hypothetical protein